MRRITGTTRTREYCLGRALDYDWLSENSRAADRGAWAWDRARLWRSLALVARPAGSTDPAHLDPEGDTARAWCLSASSLARKTVLEGREREDDEAQGSRRLGRRGRPLRWRADQASRPCARRRQAHGRPAFWIEQLAAGLEFPWAMAFEPNGDILITERTGHIKIWRKGRIVGELKNVPKVLIALSYDGLFDIDLDPDFATNHTLYLTFIDGQNNERQGRLWKGRLEGDRLVDGHVIYTVQPSPPPGGPFVYRTLFLPDKTLLFAVGSGDESGAALVQRKDKRHRQDP